MDPLTRLPREVVYLIFSRYLSDDDLCCVSQVSRSWNALTRIPLLDERRRRHVTYQRHIWTIQSQNLLAGIDLINGSGSCSSAGSRVAVGSNRIDIPDIEQGEEVREGASGRAGRERGREEVRREDRVG